MPTLAMLDLLAQLPESEVYIDPWKLLGMLVVFTLWALFAQWVDKDTVAVNTYRTIWNTVSMVTGTIAVILLLFLPSYWFGMAAFVLINGVVATIYIIHRNGLVVEEDKVATPAHIKRLFSEGFRSSKKKEKREISERVRITGADGKVAAIPEEDELREQYGLVQDLLFDAIWNRASFVEVVPAGQNSKVRLQIDGVTTERDPLPRPHGDSIVQFFKQVAGLDIEERRKPQKGQIMAAIGGDQRFDVIVRTGGSSAGEKLQLRIVGEEKNYKITDIGLTEEQLTVVREAMHAEHGLILLSAPPKNGLTTTVYSFARSHDAFLENIQMLEYEPELEVINITRCVYTPSDEKSFADELQRIIRTDPDVIVLPEIREKAAAPIACTAATRKQTVYVAIPSTDLFDALRRWASMVGDVKLLAASLSLVLHQRLLRKLCPSCKTPYKPDPATLQKINMPPDKVLYRPPEPQYDKHGNPILCQHCHGTGYVGRTGVFNMLVMDDELRKVIAGGGSLSDIKTVAARKGSLSLQQQALHKVFEGVTSIEEVVRVTRPPRPAGKAAPKAKSDKPSAA